MLFRSRFDGTVLRRPRGDLERRKLALNRIEPDARLGASLARIGCVGSRAPSCGHEDAQREVGEFGSRASTHGVVTPSGPCSGVAEPSMMRPTNWIAGLLSTSVVTPPFSQMMIRTSALSPSGTTNSWDASTRFL